MIWKIRSVYIFWGRKVISCNANICYKSNILHFFYSITMKHLQEIREIVMHLLQQWQAPSTQPRFWLINITNIFPLPRDYSQSHIFDPLNLPKCSLSAPLKKFIWICQLGTINTSVRELQLRCFRHLIVYLEKEKNWL